MFDLGILLRIGFVGVVLVSALYATYHIKTWKLARLIKEKYPTEFEKHKITYDTTTPNHEFMLEYSISQDPVLSQDKYLKKESKSAITFYWLSMGAIGLTVALMFAYMFIFNR